MERLKVFNSNHTYIGEESRDKVHKEGLWHETFHCWLVDGELIYIQRRSATKKDFPRLFDITAAGHLLASETVIDGIREVKEELGINIDLSKLRSVGIMQDIIELPNFLDFELAHVFLYEATITTSEFSLQIDEVESVHVLQRADLIDLFLRKVPIVTCKNIFDGTLSKIGLIDFVPHEKSYFEKVALLLE